MNIGFWLQRTAGIHPDRPAIYLGRDLVADYATFHRKAAQVAGWLVAQGVKPGDRVGIFMKNLPDYLITQYGVWYAGAAVVPINNKLHGREAKFILENSGVEIAFTSPGLTEAVIEAGAKARCIDVSSGDYAAIFETAPLDPLVARDSDDLCWLFYTSGTTGKPKGVMISHRMLISMSLSYMADADVIYPKDSVLYAAPMSHGAGIYNMMHTLMGARHVVPTSGAFDEAEIFDLARHHGRVQMFAAPTMVKRMTQIAKETGETGEGLRTVVYAGGPMYVADIVEAVDHFGPIFVQIYGQGECPMCITALSRHDVTDRTHPRWKERLASVGRAQSVVEVMIGDADGNEMAAGEVGEIMVRGDAIMLGYWKNEEATAKTIVNGWLLTGDMGFMDDDGYVTMQDRSKDMIISGGSNIYPREVEEVLLTHPSVAEVSVVGRPNDEWGEDVVAFVVPSGDEIDTAQLGVHCLENIARFKRPKEYYAISELPKNNYGKVLKTDLRDKLKEMAND